jgi:hypothetical protein
MSAKKATKSSSTKTSIRKESVVAKQQAKPLQLLVLSVFGLAMAYGFVSWAIETGSLWLYAFCFISLYYALDYLRKFIKATVFKKEDHVKKHPSKTRRA